MTIDETAPPLGPARVLVVDDDVAIRGTIKRYLRQYDIELADSVEDAVRHLEQQRYDLVLLDRRLPDGLGDEVVAHVRARGWSLPVVMMSGEVDPRAHLQRGGADDFIEKPFVREALVDKVERLLTAHALRKQAARQRQELAELHDRREREVDVARTIFDRMFARGEFDPAKVRHLVLAADRLAGDVVFGARLAGDVYRWMIGDVTGHTLASALVTMPLASIFYASARGGHAFGDALMQMERELAMMLPASMFCVAAMCELDRRCGRLRVWNGGNPDVLIRHTGGELTRIASSSLPLAADRYGAPVHPVVEHQVAHGDRIYAFSDGLIELRGPSREMLGFERVLTIAHGGSAETVFDRLVGCIPDVRGEATGDDDISLIEVVV
jgi:two-component system, HptB-dependent secretion and biofilm response regulator